MNAATTSFSGSFQAGADAVETAARFNFVEDNGA